MGMYVCVCALIQAVQKYLPLRATLLSCVQAHVWFSVLTWKGVLSMCIALLFVGVRSGVTGEFGVDLGPKPYGRQAFEILLNSACRCFLVFIYICCHIMYGHACLLARSFKRSRSIRLCECYTFVLCASTCVVLCAGIEGCSNHVYCITFCCCMLRRHC